MPSIADLRRIAEVEFADIVRDTLIIDHKLRIFLGDESFMDVNLSQRLPDKFGHHWERMDMAKIIRDLPWHRRHADRQRVRLPDPHGIGL